jgi:pyruvate dehydrogenase (quinone)
VAVVVIPGEIFLQRADASGYQTRGVTPTRSVVRPDDESLRQAAEILNGAAAVTILGGAGVEGCHDELIQAATTLNAPIVHALRGKEFIEYDNPFDVGMTGLLGFASGYKAIMEADALLLLGTDFPYQQFYPDNAKIGNLGSWAKDRVAARHQQRHDQWRCLRPGEQTGRPGDRRSRAVLGKTIP